MKLSLGYGKGNVELEVAETNLVGILEPHTPVISQSEKDVIFEALQNPIRSNPLSHCMNPGEKVAIITSDITRPMPSSKVLPVIVDQVNRAGIPDRDICVVFGLGIHRPHAVEEHKQLMGEELYERVKCMDSDPRNVVHLGRTSRGTPIDIFKPVVDADKRICLGNIEYHYFAGFSGGMKAIMPGVSTRDAIEANHSHMLDEKAATGRIDDNPIRQDIDEVADFLRIAFAFNVVLDEKKRIINAFAGHVIDAHRQGCKYLDSIYRIEIPKPADIVIVSPGGFPKDINLYQAQKALDNAGHAVKEGGTIILAASCKEGFGEGVFEEWLLQSETPDAILNRIRESFRLGGHKAAAIAALLKKAKVRLVSDLPDDTVRSIFMTPCADVETALEDALREQGDDASVIVMPYGGSTLPCCS
ncbi:MAG: nickel-dependent lactate racemase [Kiritimatiellia bacterium]|jgi:nickel-dependent lactate racemase|nr:nickel-dependent lactate racemase [Kiritimatiellia bacterium]MDP6848689.1 nickel-dependent lactate racemase [Kiritimatiellia bacterium]